MHAAPDLFDQQLGQAVFHAPCPAAHEPAQRLRQRQAGIHRGHGAVHQQGRREAQVDQFGQAGLPPCMSRRVACRPAGELDFGSLGWDVVRTLLDWKWSPQQIAATLKPAFPNEPEWHVLHETIYTAIYAQPRGELRTQLVACLHHGRSTRMPRSRGEGRRGQIPEMVSIHVRPHEVDDRVRPGHWQGDFIKGAGNKFSVGVLVERTSRLMLLAKMDDATAASALAGFSVKLNSIAAPLRKSFTYDQGKEMSRQVDLAAQTGLKVYFCVPHSSWQRGTCENTNGLIGQYLPKGTDLSVFSQDELGGIADSLNTRPRYAQLAYPARGVRADLEQLSQAFILSSLNRMLRFGLETAIFDLRQIEPVAAPAAIGAPDHSAMKKAAPMFSCGPSNLKRCGSSTVRCMPCGTAAGCDSLCSDYCIGRRSSRRPVGSVGCFGAGHARPDAMNEPASALVALTNAASRRFS